MKTISSATARREQIRQEYWPGENLWMGDKQKGWFPAPRTLPLIMALLSQKELSKNQDPSRVYFELFSRHLDSGVIEMVSESEHAFASGYEGQRAVRTWQERMQLLSKLGFIKIAKVGNQTFRFVGLVHPTVAIQLLRDKSRVPDDWWRAYCARKAETKEATFEQLAAGA